MSNEMQLGFNAPVSPTSDQYEVIETEFEHE